MKNDLPLHVKGDPDYDHQDATAAVALLLASNSDLEILLVERVNSPGDPWSGHIAFPGGKRSPSDATLKDTVVREVAEEVGIEIHDHEFRGVLRPFISPPKPDMKILPFVILLDERPQVTLNREELQSFMWSSVNHLHEYEGTTRTFVGEVPAFTIGEYVVWGLTYRILTHFLTVLHMSGQQPRE
ncbi:MAG: CoA pyrophosphatase [Theionarchaea archaeon]|nr:CoA pyrophosphatase [Theionarchaea archaeon]MBU7036293.1 CoA pyrophosphatase [Theionarchaea archaeon]